MSENDAVDLAAKPLNPKYLSHLLDNINATQDHLTGNDNTPLSPSFLSPGAIWTPQEKNAFFHALSVHSRFRPDLISHEIKTKSVSDVCNYLYVLQLAASQQEDTVLDSQWRQNLQIAMEVSSEWVVMEEETALDIIGREKDWQREFVTEKRRAKLKLLKSTLKTELHGIEPSRRKAKLQQEIANTDLRDRQEDFCGSLGSLELAAIGPILREAIHSPGQGVGLETAQMFPFSATGGGSNILDANAATTLTSSISATFSVASMQSSPNPARPQLNSKGKSSPQSSSERSHSCSPQQDSKAVLAGLSPASRRRYQKRLYMRRKRASVSGVTAIDESLERLKPGRKGVKRSPSPEDKMRRALELSTPEDRVVEDSGDTISAHEADGSSVSQKGYPRAKQMVIDKLRGLDLSADEVRRLGLGVLNPEGVAKMLKYDAYHLISSTPSLT